MLEQAQQWQQEEIGQSGGFELIPSKQNLFYRVWYQRTGAHVDEQVLIKTDTALHHWPAISDFLAYRIRKTHDVQCEMWPHLFRRATPSSSNESVSTHIACVVDRPLPERAARSV